MFTNSTRIHLEMFDVSCSGFSPTGKALQQFEAVQWCLLSLCFVLFFSTFRPNKA